jgi:hypothetical protein
MNKEIISSGTSSRRKIFIQPAQGENVYTYWAYCSVRLQKALQIGWNILKPEYFGIKNNSLNQLQNFD